MGISQPTPLTLQKGGKNTVNFCGPPAGIDYAGGTTEYSIKIHIQEDEVGQCKANIEASEDPKIVNTHG
jgi:hypothetical protein